VGDQLVPAKASTHPKPPTVLHHDQRLEPAIVYPPGERTIYNDRSYSWGCICKVTTATDLVGSAALIGQRHLLTASHCVDWGTSAAENIEGHLTGTTAAATAFDTLAYTFTHISGDPTVTTLDEDYPCLVLDQRLGDVFGWLGTKTYDSSWDDDNVWWSMGYPTDIASGLQPTFIKNKNMDEDEWDLGSGRAMTTSADMMKGQSGSAMFGFWEEGTRRNLSRMRSPSCPRSETSGRQALRTGVRADRIWAASSGRHEMRIHNGALSTIALRGEFQGIPPTGKQVAFSGMEFDSVVGARWRSTGSSSTCSD